MILPAVFAMCYSVPVEISAAAAPHSDVIGQDDVSGPPVECFQDGCGSFARLTTSRQLD